MNARQAIDRVSESGDLEQSMRQRQHLINCLKDPKFAARRENPRTAIKGDIVAITTKMNIGVETRVATLTSDAEPAQWALRDGTQVNGTEFSFVPPNLNIWDLLHSGSGSSRWRDPPGEWGVQTVELIGRDYTPAHWTPRRGDHGYDLG